MSKKRKKYSAETFPHKISPLDFGPSESQPGLCPAVAFLAFKSEGGQTLQASSHAGPPPPADKGQQHQDIITELGELRRDEERK